MNQKVALLSLTAGVVLGILGTTLFQMLQGSHRSPYANQTKSTIRGLNAQEVEDLLQGRGAGYARMAELNSYPGPRHVLDLKQELSLSAKQEQAVQATFENMQRHAQQLGTEIVSQEGRLSQAFATAAVTPEILDLQTQELADLYGKLRATHLQAHLEITSLLSAQQIEQYDQLRGYADTASISSHHH